MKTPESQKSLPQILKDRYDTRIDGHRIEDHVKSTYSDSDKLTLYEDCYGDFWGIENDHVLVRPDEYRPVGMLVADESDRHIGVEHPHGDLPHLIGLYVREPYRSRGIATGLINDFMDRVDADSAISDCKESLQPFYDRLDHEIIYLRQFKNVG
jgi:GNAT superfamily N-acetyltransferase